MYDFARVDLPDPGGTIIMVLCRPAAAISAFRFAVCSPVKFRKVFSERFAAKCDWKYCYYCFE